jgi:hypothetical protein
MPKLKETNELVVSSMFLDDRDNSHKLYPLAICKQYGNVIWAQPIYLMQNRYPSAMLNEWDGSLKIDEDNNSILTAMVGAGRKNTNN